MFSQCSAAAAPAEASNSIGRIRPVFLLIDSQMFRLSAYCTTYHINLDTVKPPVAEVSNGSDTSDFKPRKDESPAT